MAGSCKHYDSLWGRCMDCGMSWEQQAREQQAQEQENS